MKQKVYHDEYGKPYVLDELGNRISPQRSEINSKPGEFTTYDTSQGHCGLCGEFPLQVNSPHKPQWPWLVS